MAFAEVAGGDIIYASVINDIINRAVNRPICRVAKTSNQSIADNTVVPITFTSETIDDLNWHSTNTNTSRITPTIAGRYLVTANLYFAASSVGDRRVYIEKNGASNGVWGRLIANGGNGLPLLVTGILTANGSTDYFEASAFQSTGGSLNVQGSGDVTFSSTFECTYLGDA